MAQHISYLCSDFVIDFIVRPVLLRVVATSERVIVNNWVWIVEVIKKSHKNNIKGCYSPELTTASIVL